MANIITCFVASGLLVFNTPVNNVCMIQNQPISSKVLFVNNKCGNPTINLIDGEIAPVKFNRDNLKSMFGEMKNLSENENIIYKKGIERKVKYSSFNIFDD